MFQFISAIDFAFDVYDFKGDGKVDGFYIGDLVRACNLNPTMKTIVEIGGEKEKGKKTIVLEDMYPLFKKAKDSKDTGGIHDFVEILKLYDKNSDKTMLSKDLFRLLTNLGNFSFIIMSCSSDPITNSENMNLHFIKFFDQFQQVLQCFSLLWSLQTI